MEVTIDVSITSYVAMPFPHPATTINQAIEVKKSKSCHQRKVRFNIRSPVPFLMDCRNILGKLSFF